MSLLSKQPNIIFLLVDTLRSDRVGGNVFAPDPAPFLNELISRGVRFSQMFSAACPTQFAMPSVFTSTRPLDFGGYEHGIVNRPDSFVEVLRHEGYDTAGFSASSHVNRYYGYDRGFDTYHHLFRIAQALRYFDVIHIYHPTLQISKNSALAARHIADMVRKIPKMLDLVRYLLAERRQVMASGQMPLSPILHDEIMLDFIDQLFIKTTQRFEAQREAFAASLFTLDATNTLFNKLWREISKQKLRSDSSAAYALTCCTHWIKQRSRDRPFFVYAHLIDIHSGIFESFDLPRSQQMRQEDQAYFSKAMRKIAHQKPGYLGLPDYDMSLAYLDQQVQRFFETLKEMRVMDNTLIVISADHGARTGGPPSFRKADAVDFYDELLHVPLAFIHPELSPRTDVRLSSMLDFAPTLLNLVNVSAPASFIGRPLLPVTNDRPPPFVMFEHVGRGLCDIAYKTICVATRSQRFKLMFRNPPQYMDGNGAVTELYDISVDPMEGNNLVNAGPLPPDVSPMIEAARARCHQIRRENQPGKEYVASKEPSRPQVIDIIKDSVMTQKRNGVPEEKILQNMVASGIKIGVAKLIYSQCP